MSRPVRLLMVGGSLGGGGAERRAIELLQHLDRRRIESQLYLTYRQGELLSEVPADVPVTAFAEDRPLIRLLAKLRCPCAARAIHLRRVLRADPPDVILTWSLMSAYEVMWATLGRRVPHLAMVVCQPQAELTDVFPRWFPFRYRLARWTYRSAQRVLANSADLQQTVAKFYHLPRETLTTVVTFRDFARIERMAAESEPAWPGMGPRLLAVGRLHPDKGLDVLIDALHQLKADFPTAQLMLLGQGPAEAALREQVVRLGLSRHVHFVGFQANPYAWLKSADLFILPSRREGMPGALIEALACGVPIVSTDCATGPSEVLEAGRWGKLVPVEDAAALAAAIGQSLRHRSTPDELNAAARSARERYDRPVVLGQLETLILKAAAREVEGK